MFLMIYRRFREHSRSVQRRWPVRPMTLLIACCAFMAMKSPLMQTTIRIRLVMGVDVVTFDPTRTPPREIKRWMQLSPNVGQDNGYLAPENIEQCDASDPRYQGCGKEQQTVNMHNAQLNINKIRKRIGNLDPAHYPTDLSKVVLYVRRLQSFGLWRNNRLVAFERSGKVSALESEFEGINPKIACSDTLNRIAHAKSHAEASRLARFAWFNCMTQAAMKHIGPYPRDAWQCFLTAHHIREEMVYEHIDP
jgi:hypothetical protein